MFHYLCTGGEEYTPAISRSRAAARPTHGDGDISALFVLLRRVVHGNHRRSVGLERTACIGRHDPNLSHLIWLSKLGGRRLTVPLRLLSWDLWCRFNVFKGWNPWGDPTYSREFNGSLMSVVDFAFGVVCADG